MCLFSLVHAHTVSSLATSSNQRQINNRSGSNSSVAVTVLAVVLGLTVLAVIIGVVIVYVKNRLVLINMHFKVNVIIHLIVVTWTRLFCLICTPSSLGPRAVCTPEFQGPQARGMRAGCTYQTEYECMYYNCFVTPLS